MLLQSQIHPLLFVFVTILSGSNENSQTQTILSKQGKQWARVARRFKGKIKLWERLGPQSQGNSELVHFCSQTGVSPIKDSREGTGGGHGQ